MDRRRRSVPRYAGWPLTLALLSAAGCAGPGGSAVLRPAAPSAEEEDLWAIRCLTLRGPNRFRVAKGYEEALKNVKGLDARLVQSFDDSHATTIYYGRYRRYYSAGSGKESFKPDPVPALDLIRRLSLTVDGRNVWPFYLAVTDALPSARRGIPAWELSNADGYWSLQVAVFYNEGEMRQRKFAAEEYCRILREQGQEAYFHHGVVNSSVCVGAFPEEAIATIRREDPLTGIVRVSEKMVDPRLLALQKKHPYNYHNGRRLLDVIRDPRTGRKHRLPHASFAVKIPRDAARRDTSPGG